MRLYLPLVLLLTAGCSRIKTAYTWLDWVLERQAHQYLDLTREQSDAAEKAIDSYLAWHRSTMLPRYAQLLRVEAASVRAVPIDRAHFDRANTELRALYEQTMGGVIELMADLLVDQAPEQIEHLDDALAERHRELVEESQEDDRLEETQEDYVDMFEDLVGDLSPGQKAALFDRVGATHGKPGPWLQERARRNAAMLARLRAGAGRDEIAGLLRTWWMGEVDPATPATYEGYRRQFTNQMETLIFELLASLDPTQREHLARRLDEVASDFEDLARTS